MKILVPPAITTFAPSHSENDRPPNRPKRSMTSTVSTSTRRLILFDSLRSLTLESRSQKMSQLVRIGSAPKNKARKKTKGKYSRSIPSSTVAHVKEKTAPKKDNKHINLCTNSDLLRIRINKSPVLLRLSD